MAAPVHQSEPRLVPLNGRVVVELVKPAEKSPGGIIMPDMRPDAVVWGRVVVSGPRDMVPDGRDSRPIRPGDRVAFMLVDAVEVQFGADRYRVIKADDLLCAIDTGE